MRVLIVHNFYQDPGGEDAVFQQEVKGLRQMANMHIETITYQNLCGAKGALQFAAYPWNFSAALRIVQKIRSFKPQLVHLHNLHYAAGPAIIRSVKAQGIPLVVTLHNYRLLCPSATLFHQGQPYLTGAAQQFPWDAIRKKVHAQSSLKTAWIACTTGLHRAIGTWKMVDRYLALTDFAQDCFLQYQRRIFDGRILVKPNFLEDPYPNGFSSNPERKSHFLFVGRLSEEKGIECALQTFKLQPNLQLRIAGDGPLRDMVLAAADRNSNIQYLGQLTQQQVLDEMLHCTALIFPSIWYEGMPMTILQAFASGTPILASDLGAMHSMITSGKNGYLFQPGNARALADLTNYWASLDLETKTTISRHARTEFETKYTVQQNLSALLSIYTQLCPPAEGGV